MSLQVQAASLYGRATDSAYEDCISILNLVDYEIIVQAN